MKKLFTMFCASVLICAFGVACHDDNGQGQDEQKGDEIQVVAVSDEVTDFLDENVFLIARAVFGDYNHDERDDPLANDRVAMINSMDEFRKIEFPDDIHPVVLPNIDFDSHTLIVGQYLVGDSASNLVKQRIVVEPEEIIMNTWIRYTQVDSKPAVYLKSYWGLYPKLPQLPITVVRK